MPESPICPQCHHLLTQVGEFWVCPKHGQISLEQTHASLRIFLSYGHDANEELVRRIYADLKQRGHDVWFDKHDITFGDDWRRSITSGITECDRFFSFLSKHSTRDPGVCLDEIRIAIGAKGGNIQSILVESEQEVKLPPSISHIQWLDMHDWQERRAAGEAAWENWYQQKLAEIIRVVESDESRKFAGEIRTLEEYLKPVVSDFATDARIQKLLEKKLTGRAWLFEAVEKWRTAADRSSRIFWMMGAPGFGKSFFAAHLAHFYGRGTVVGVHFCAYDKPDHRSAPRIIRTLAFQLATRLPDYRKLLLTLPEIAELDRKQTAAELFDYLLANPLKLSITGGRERLLIVIDALDEAGGDGRNELVEMLARHAPSLPDWIGLVVTSRPESDVRAPLQGLNPFILDTATEANRADLREYLRHELAPQLQPRTNADRLIEQILEKSEGVFLYAEHFCDDVQRGHLSLDHPEQFPQGLGGIFFQWFQRQFPDAEQYEQKIEPMLGAILAAREPLPVEILQKLFNWRETELRKWLRKLGSLFPVAKENDCEVIKPYHKSLADWLADEAKAGDYFVSELEGHRVLADSGWRIFHNDVVLIPDYFRKHLPAHIFEARRTSDFCELMLSAEYLHLRRCHGESVDLLMFCDRVLEDTHILSASQSAKLSAWLCSTPEDAFGRILHEKWYADMKKSGRPAYLWPDWQERVRLWPSLSREHRSKWWRDVVDIFAILRNIGLGARPAGGTACQPLVLTAEELDGAAEGEHERWCREAKVIGWIYAPAKDIQKLQTPWLVSWSEIPEDVKAYARSECRDWPEIFARGGYELYRLKPVQTE